jgi:ectoine hydroxylase-related dioxygenase (phytanoyl-CoA dioxygenase family)
LFQLAGGCFVGDADDDNNDVNADHDHAASAISKDTICISYTAKDSQVIAETYKRLQLATDQAAANHAASLQQRVVKDLLEPASNGVGNNKATAATAAACLQELQTAGVVRINNALSRELAATCLEAINKSLTEPTADSQFGNVFSRKNRYDMYLRPVQQYKAALQSMLSEHAVLGQLFDAWLQDKEGVFHEFSALVADPGADSQPIHPDAPYSHLAPLLTVFCALQDVVVGMGPTVFLSASHSAKVHDSLTSPSKDAMLAAAEYRQASLKAGDVAVMDARTLHFGSANTSDTRRTLLYFTIRNPAHGTTNADFPDCGSLFSDLHMTTSDFSQI